MTIKLGSLFDGAGTCPLAATLLGIEPVWASEIEPFPIKVTSSRFPHMKHLGDVSKVHGGEIEPVDIITFGSPCQDMSVAGKRAGLEGERSILFMDAIRIIKEMRNKTDGKYPRFAMWENVPGAYSSNKGEDFRTVIEEFVKIKEEGINVPRPTKGKWDNEGLVMGDGYSIAWRTLDAKFWGVPQRRRRIFLVADFGGQCAGEILFKSEGLSRDFASCRKTWEGITPDAERCTGTTGGGNDIASTLYSAYGTKWNGNAGAYNGDNFVIDNAERISEKGIPILNMSQPNNEPTWDVSPTLLSRMGTGGNQVPVFPVRNQLSSGFCTEHGHQPLILEKSKKVYSMDSVSSNSMKSKNPNSGFHETEIARCLDNSSKDPTCNQGGNVVVFNEETVTSKTNASNPQINDPCHTLGATGAGRAILVKPYVSPNEHENNSTICLQGSMIGRKDKNGPQGDGVNDDVSFTLNTIDRHAVAYAMTTGGFAQVTKEQSPTLLARDYKDAPAIFTDESVAFGGSSFAQYEENKVSTIKASGGDLGGGSETLIKQNYIVRRLTPKECAKLQGMPSWWCDDIAVENPTEEDIEFWEEVFDTYGKINDVGAKSRKQIIKWLQDPYSDTAEYKMWGNGMALPCVLYVLENIKRYVEQ